MRGMLDYPACSRAQADGRGYARNGRGGPGSDLQGWRLDGSGSNLQVTSEKVKGGQRFMGLGDTDAPADVLK